MDNTAEPLSTCPDCETTVDANDNYCRNCGMFVSIGRQLPVKQSTQRSVQQRPAGLPTPVKRAATAVAVGAVLQVGASLAGKYLLRQAAQSVTSSALGGSSKKKRNLPAKTAEASPVEAPVTVISETFMIRRVWMRRDS